MKIELLLNRVSYDRAQRTGDIAFNGYEHGPASGDPDISATLSVINLRKEEWGGLFVYGPTGQVYTVDDEAYEALSQVRDNRNADALKKDEKAYKAFMSQLEANKIKL